MESFVPAASDDFIQSAASISHPYSLCGRGQSRDQGRKKEMSGWPEKRLWFMAAITILIIICCPMAAPSCTSHEKEREERIGRWYPARSPTIHNMLCARKTVWRGPGSFWLLRSFWYALIFREGKYGFPLPRGSGTTKLPRKNCACHLVVTINGTDLRKFFLRRGIF